MQSNSSSRTSLSSDDVESHRHYTQRLPPEILLEIIDHLLDPFDVLCVSLTCTAWYKMTSTTVPKTFSNAAYNFEMELAEILYLITLLTTTSSLGLNYPWTSSHVRIKLKIPFEPCDSVELPAQDSQEYSMAVFVALSELAGEVRYIHLDFAKLPKPSPQLGEFFSSLHPLCSFNRLTVENYPTSRGGSSPSIFTGLSHLVLAARATLTHIHLREVDLDKPLQYALTQCRLVSHARFTSMHPYDVQQLIIAWGPILRHVQFDPLPMQMGTVPDTLSWTCPHLETLEISSNEWANVSVTDLRNMASRFKGNGRMCALAFADTSASEDWKLEALLQEILPLRPSGPLGIRSRGGIVKWMHLEVLDLRRCEGVQSSLVTEALDMCPKLRVLGVSESLLEGTECDVTRDLKDGGFRVAEVDGGTEGRIYYRDGVHEKIVREFWNSMAFAEYQTLKDKLINYQ